MENEPELIRQRMQDNRTSLTEKLEALEQQVMGVASSVTNTVENVKDGVQDTVDAVKESVQDTVDAVKDTVEETTESVKGAFDLPRQVDRHPWAMMGASVGAGLLLSLLFRSRSAESAAQPVSNGTPAPQPKAAHEHNGGTNGVTHELLDTVKDGLSRVKDMALATLFATVKELFTNRLPEAAEAQVKSLFDDALARLKTAAQPAHAEPAATQFRKGQGGLKGERKGSGRRTDLGQSADPAW